tara:strand:- start:8093 stop:8527 length:435 start_codon:yes stop_codon:yes gene_type:complete
LLILISGCSSVKPIQVEYQPADRVPLDLPAVDQVVLDRISWYIITEANGKDIFETLEKKRYDPVLFGLTDKDYEALSVNMTKIMMLVRQQKSIIEAYQKYYEAQYQEIEDTNKANKQMMEEAEKQNKKAEEAGLLNKFKNILGK